VFADMHAPGVLDNQLCWPSNCTHCSCACSHHMRYCHRAARPRLLAAAVYRAAMRIPQRALCSTVGTCVREIPVQTCSPCSPLHTRSTCSHNVVMEQSWSATRDNAGTRQLQDVRRKNDDRPKELADATYQPLWHFQTRHTCK
jgi:hypothetical protein